jgi:hypothetical protein
MSDSNPAVVLEQHPKDPHAVIETEERIRHGVAVFIAFSLRFFVV